MRNSALHTAVLALVMGMQIVCAQDLSTSYESDHRLALERFELGQSSLNSGKLPEAEAHFAAAVKLAPANSQLRRDAEEALTYRLPLMRAQRLAFTGHVAGAERILLQLIETFEDDPLRREELQRMRTALKANLPPKAPGPEADGRAVLRQVALILDDYRRQHERYPADYRELNKLLPVGEQPLEQYEIIEYVGRGDGYKMLLRSKQRRNNVLTLEKTGLLR